VQSFKELWNSVAETRSNQISTGKDITFTRFFVPLYNSILEEFKPSNLCEVGCGTGHLLYSLSPLCTSLVGFDEAKGMIEIAKSVTKKAKNISIHECSLSKATQFGNFDFVISHLCAQAIENLQLFFNNIKNLMKPKGKCLITIPHPCFWNTYQGYIPDDAYHYMQETHAIAQLSIRGEYTGDIPYFHRPLSIYFSKFLDAGLQLESFKELYPSKITESLYEQEWLYPRFLMFRLTHR